MNDQGRVVFGGVFPDSSNPIGRSAGFYRGPNPEEDAIVQLYKPFQGSEVEWLLGLYPGLLNNANQVAFTVDFANGDTGVYLARFQDNTGPEPPVVPEPSSLFLLGSGLLGLIVSGRRFRP